MTHMTMEADMNCGADVQRALILNGVWWAGFIGALIAAWTLWPDAHDALAYGLSWLGVGGGQ